MADDQRTGSRPEDERKGERFRRLSEQLTGLLDPEAALRRGAGIVTGVSQATKDEVMRIVGAEMRRFLDKMDIADLAQHIIAGLALDVSMQIKFSRVGDETRPELTKLDTDVSTGAASKKSAPRDNTD